MRLLPPPFLARCAKQWAARVARSLGHSHPPLRPLSGCFPRFWGGFGGISAGPCPSPSYGDPLMVGPVGYGNVGTRGPGPFGGLGAGDLDPLGGQGGMLLDPRGLMGMGGGMGMAPEGGRGGLPGHPGLPGAATSTLVWGRFGCSAALSRACVHQRAKVCLSPKHALINHPQARGSTLCFRTEDRAPAGRAVQTLTGCAPPASTTTTACLGEAAVLLLAVLNKAR